MITSFHCHSQKYMVECQENSVAPPYLMHTSDIMYALWKNIAVDLGMLLKHHGLEFIRKLRDSKTGLGLTVKNTCIVEKTKNSKNGKEILPP